MLNITFIDNDLHIKRIRYIQIELSHTRVRTNVFIHLQNQGNSYFMVIVKPCNFENYVRLHKGTTALATVVKCGPVLVTKKY